MEEVRGQGEETRERAGRRELLSSPGLLHFLLYVLILLHVALQVVQKTVVVLLHLFGHAAVLG